MADRYASFAGLAANEQVEVDYRIRVVDRGTPVVIIAPHGGWIEPGTSEIAEALADIDLSFYSFESLRNGPHGGFHITSHRFDEPQAIALVRNADVAIAIHGRKDDRGNAIWLGGRGTNLRDAIGLSLREVGFATEIGDALPGLHLSNICNRTQSGKGVQVEVPLVVRRKLTSDPRLLATFCCALRSAVMRRPCGSY